MNTKSMIATMLFAFSCFSYANLGAHGHFLASLTILPSGNSCGMSNEGTVCSSDAKLWDKSLKAKKDGFIVSKENCQAYRDDNFIIVSY